MHSLKHYLSHPRDLGVALVLRMEWLPDEIYLRLLYFFEMGKRLNLNNPCTFQEKMQWLKLNNRKPEYTKMVDKVAVKDYVAEKLGRDYVIPTLGVWERFDDIDFDKLPDKFVLKTTHGGGGCGVVVCKNKATFNKSDAKKKLEQSLQFDIYRKYREWPYKNVPKRILAEQLLELPDTTDLTDYKFFCFNGEPLFFKVDFGRFVQHHANYYDMDWNLLPFGEKDYPPDSSHDILPPPNFSKMVEIVRQLSKGHPFLRVDLYNLAGTIYFGELTFFPASGLGDFIPCEYNTKIGRMISLIKT